MSVTIENLKEVEYEIRRYRKRVRDLKDRMNRIDSLWTADFPHETGAIKRASMDLSKALVKLRASE